MKFLRFFVIITVVLSYSSVVHAAVSDDLVSYWDFNENTGITAADSENNNDGTLANTDNVLDKGVTWNNLDSIEGSSVEFDGSGGDNYNTIIVPDHSSLDFDTTTDFAISAWIKADSSTADDFIQIVGKNSGYGTKGYNMVIDNLGDDKLRMLIDWGW